jgi:hypothetical protein
MNKKYQKLILGIVLDAIGFITVIPFDVVWAPVSGYIISKMYKGNKGKIAGVISFLEEIIPGIDIIPTFTIMWVYTYIINKEDENIKKETVIEA